MSGAPTYAGSLAITLAKTVGRIAAMLDIFVQGSRSAQGVVLRACRIAPAEGCGKGRAEQVRSPASM